MAGTTVRLGVLGLHNHYHIYPMAEYLRREIDGVQLVAVYDERQELAEEFAKFYGGQTFTVRAKICSASRNSTPSW